MAKSFDDLVERTTTERTRAKAARKGRKLLKQIREPDLLDAARHIKAFERGNMTGRLALLESAFCGADRAGASELCKGESIGHALMQAAFAFKVAAGQINVLIHAAGILMSIPHILLDGEEVERLSLGAGNTGRDFDLETSHRIAEFKFISWRGGAESVRQNGVFKDFFRLAEAKTDKERWLYLLELDRPLPFLNGGRALLSILSRDSTLRRDFETLYGDRFTVARDYYLHRRNRVQLGNLAMLVPEFVETAL
jgi:hypothetical protein